MSNPAGQKEYLESRTHAFPSDRPLVIPICVKPLSSRYNSEGLEDKEWEGTTNLISLQFFDIAHR